MAKITKAERTRRVEKVVSLLLMGAKRADIILYASQKANWGVSERQITTYIKYATEEIKAQSHDEIEFERGRMKERLESLYQGNIKKKDFRAALAVTKERGEMLGIYASKKVDVTSGGEKIKGYAVVSPDDFDDAES